MNNLLKTDDQWIPLQANVFSRWISSELKCSHQPIDITKDLSDGTTLIELAQALTHKKIEQNWSKNPQSNIEKTQNCDLAIDLLKKNGVRIVGISGKDISDNNEKLILGLIWSLISHYSVEKSIQQTETINDKDNNIINNHHMQPLIRNKISLNEQKNALMSWANSRTQNYPYIHNFKPYDLSMCALLDSYFPDKIKYKNLKPENHQGNSELAIDVMIEYGIPVFIYTDDLKKNDYNVDSKALLTQLSFVKSSIDDANIKIGLDIIENEEDEKIKSESESDETENENDIVDESSEEELVSEPIEINDEEMADDEEIQNETTDSSQSTISQHKAEENKLGFMIDYKDDANHNHSKKRIRIRIKGKNDEDEFQVNEEEEVQSFMKKYLCLKNIGQSIDGNKNVKIRVKYHGKIIEKVICTPFHNINVHLHHRSHHHSSNETENESSYEYDNESSEQNETEEENSNYNEEKNEYEEEERKENIEKENGFDLEKRAEIEDEIEAEIEKEYEAECDEKEITNSSNQIKSKSALHAEEKNKSSVNIPNKLPEQPIPNKKKFGFTITLKGSDYNNGGRVEENINKDGPSVTLALTLVHCDSPFLNSSGLKLDLAEADIKNNINQQFFFHHDENDTVIDSVYKTGMVWDVADADKTNPPEGTPFYLFPFHGRHNQRFVYKNEMIYALQNNQVVTYVGGYTPLVMMPPREDLKSRQTFHVSFL